MTAKNGSNDPVEATGKKNMEKNGRYRMTRQREVILEEILNAKAHPSADEVYEMVRKRLPRISLGTVYRNLEILSELGEIQKLELGGDNPARNSDYGCEFTARRHLLDAWERQRAEHPPEPVRGAADCSSACSSDCPPRGARPAPQAC